MMFERERQIRFSECDPAGIVFYPQYFVMFNDLMEFSRRNLREVRAVTEDRAKLGTDGPSFPGEQG